MAPKEPVVYGESRRNCVRRYESGLTCRGRGSELGLRQSLESVRLGMWNLPKSVPGVLKEAVKKAITWAQEQ